MTILNALNGLVSDALDRLADRVARTEKSRQATKNTAADYVTDERGGRALIAKMARAEVKNYLAALAEGAEVPFTSPEQLVAMLNEQAHKSFITMTPDEFQSLTSLADAGRGLEFHGDDCPGHSTGRPADSCREAWGLNPVGEKPVATCDDLGHDPRIHSPSGQAEIAREHEQHVGHSPDVKWLTTEGKEPLCAACDKEEQEPLS